VSCTSHIINATLYPKLPFDPIADFTPIAMISTVPSLLVGNPKVPAQNLQELIALAKSNPGVLTMAIGGIGSSLHLAGDRFKMMADVNIVNVPYKGTAPALTDLLGGQVDLMFISLVTGTVQVRAGNLRAYGVTSAARQPSFPDLPAIVRGSRRPGSVCSGRPSFRTRLLKSLIELWSMPSRTRGCASSSCTRAQIRPR
jgi:tripartite-type tricarboxylate transporter receptor subunit TctC